MPKAPRAKYYAVRCGRQPGVYDTWDEAEKQITGFPGALHKSFPNRMAALGWAGLLKISKKPVMDLLDRDPNVPKGRQPTKKENPPPLPPNKPSVDQQSPPLAETPQPQPSEPPLSDQQNRILKKILSGDNFFFTGSAGTGKSVLLRAIIKSFADKSQGDKSRVENDINAYLRGEGDVDDEEERGRYGGRDMGGRGAERWKLGITASTGMAAINIGGCTLHSWAGIGLGQFPKEQLLAMILKNNVTRDRWRSTGALIIDEISMIDGKLIDKLEWIARQIRSNSKPFGGLQIILSGDFFQLPPVAKRDGPAYTFAFDADSWPRVFPEGSMMGLTRVFRQKEDKFVRVLEGMRKGRTTADAAKVLAGCNRVVKYDDGIEPVSLYPSKKEVEAVNRQRLAALTSPILVYTAADIPGTNSKGYPISAIDATESLNRNTIWPAEVGLKVGAMVMLVTNMQDGALVNGSTGIVVDFLNIADATAQGVYIPARTTAFKPASAVLWPVIEFVPSKYGTMRLERRTLIPQMAVDVMNAMGTPEAIRHQIPLILAWALTIHKSQGQTLERVRVDLNNIFVEGQTYVAISRAVSLDSLEIRNYAPHKVHTHPRVLKWAEPFEEEQAADEEWDELLADASFDA